MKAKQLVAALSTVGFLMNACASGDAVPSPIESQRPELLVGAASSLEPLFRALGTAFEKENGAKVTFVFGASGTISRQIEEGAPLDVFASADVGFARRLQDKNLVQNGAYASIAEGRLAAITSLAVSPEASWQDLATDSRVRFIAIANPELAPFGHQTRAVLKQAGLWEQLRSKLVFGQTVAQVFQFVASANADVGFTGQSLVMQNVPSGVTVIPINACAHGGLSQTLVGISTTPHLELTERFVNFTINWVTPQVLEQYGYDPPLDRFHTRECP